MSDKRILLVEDDPNVREPWAELLRDLGHTVVAVDTVQWRSARSRGCTQT